MNSTGMRHPSLFWTIVVTALVLFLTLLAARPVASFIRQESYSATQKSAQLKSMGGETVKVFADTDNDGKIEMTIFYKNGNKDHSEIDVNHDGRTDTWINYYITGEIVKTVEDLNLDGQPDYWMYFKNGQLYKWEQDRNFDSKVDIRTLFSVGGPNQNGYGNFVSQSSDDDFNGSFENMVYSEGSEKKIPYSWAEAKYLNR